MTIFTSKPSGDWLNENWSTLFEYAPDAIHILDLSGNLLAANPAFYRLLGRPAEGPEAPQNAREWDTHWNETRATSLQDEAPGTTHTHQTSFRCVDGSLRAIEARLTVLPLARMLCTARDLGAIPGEQDNLQGNLLREVLDHSQDVSYRHNLSSGHYDYLNQAFFEISGYTPDEFKNLPLAEVLLLIHPDERVQKQAEIDEAVANQRQLFFQLEYRLRHKDGHYIWCQDRFSVQRDETGAPLALVGSIREISAQKETEQALREKTEFLAQVIEHMGQGLTVSGMDRHFEMVNPAYARLLGYTPQELIGTHPNDLTVSDDHVSLDEAYARRQRGETNTYETRLQRVDGSLVPVLITGVPRMQNGELTGSIAVITDLSEIKQAEKLQREALERLQKIASRVPGVVYQYRLRPDGSSCFPFASEAIREIYQVSPEEVREDASKVFAMLHPDDYDGIVASIQSSARTLTPWQYEYRVKFENGDVSWLHGNAVPQLEPDGSVLWHGFISDITTRKQADAALAALALRNQTLLNTAIDGIHILDDQGRLVEANPAFCAMLGYTHAELLQMRVGDWDAQWSHAELMERIAEIILQPTVFETQHRRKDGSIRQVEINAVGVTLDGRNYLYASSRDITERKRAEQALRESEEKYRSFVSQATESFTLTDERGVVIEWNQAAERFTGIPATKALGKYSWEINARLAPPEVRTPQLQENLRKSLEPLLREGKGPQLGKYFEVNLVMPDGTKRHIRQLPFVIKTSSGYRIGAITRDVTEEKLAEQKLRESEEKYHSFVSQSAEAFALTDEQGRIIEWNHAAEVISNIPAGEALGNLVWEVQMRMLAPETRNPRQSEAIRQTTQQLLSSGQSPLLGKYSEARIVRTDGKQIFMSQILFTIKTATGYRIASITRDVTENKLAEQKLRESEKRFADIFNASPVGIIIARISDGRCVDANPAFYEIMQITPEQTLGRTWREMNMQIDQASITHMRETMSQLGGTGLVEVRVSTGASETKDLLVSIRVINLAGEDCALVMGRDISAIKRAEEALRAAHTELEQRVEQRTAELKTANRELEKAMRLKDEFLAAVSHELRTPLTGILGLAQSLQAGTFGALPEAQVKPVDGVVVSGLRLLEMVNKLLDLASLKAGRMAIRPRPCLAEDICRASLKTVETSARQKNLQASFEANPGILILNTDEAILQRMLNHLLSNAVKFTPAGGSFGIQLSLDETEHCARICVWDTGIGIKPEDLPRLFEPFVQLDGGLTRRYQGSGLGLAIVHLMAELQGNRLDVQSTPGEGSRFTIILPWEGY